MMPHVLIKYAHVLICISAGKGSRHFSAFYLLARYLYKIKIIQNKYSGPAVVQAIVAPTMGVTGPWSGHY